MGYWFQQKFANNLGFNSGTVGVNSGLLISGGPALPGLTNSPSRQAIVVTNPAASGGAVLYVTQPYLVSGGPTNAAVSLSTSIGYLLNCTVIIPPQDSTPIGANGEVPLILSASVMNANYSLTEVG